MDFRRPQLMDDIYSSRTLPEDLTRDEYLIPQRIQGPEEVEEFK